MSNNVEGKVVVITGASSGLGEASARLLSANGASVVLGARRVNRLRSLADELAASGGKALSITTDVTHYDQVQRLVDAALQTYGHIDVMINNAGLMPSSPLECLKVEDWNRMIDVNIKGVLWGIAAVLPYMKQQNAGHIINVSSVAGPQGSRRWCGLCSDQACRTGPIRSVAPGSEAPQHSYDGDLTGRSGQGTA